MTEDGNYFGTIGLTEIIKYQSDNELTDDELNEDISLIAKTDEETVGLDYDLTEVMRKLVDQSFLPVLGKQEIRYHYSKIYFKSNQCTSIIFHSLQRRKKMNKRLNPLSKTKKSLNSQKSYTYDLQQFLTVTEGEISSSPLIYQQFLLDLKPFRSEKKNQLSINFYFLYESGHMDRFYKLQAMASSGRVKKRMEREDLSLLFRNHHFFDGQLITLLIALLGLTPSEIAELKSEQINLKLSSYDSWEGLYQTVLSLPKELLSHVENHLTGKIWHSIRKGTHTLVNGSLIGWLNIYYL